MERLHEYITLREKQFSIRAMCRVLKISESGYYCSLYHTRTPRPWQLLLVKIRENLAEHPDNSNYGIKRMRLALEQKDIIESRSTVRRAMKKGGFLKNSPRRPAGLTKADADAQKAENLIRRNFTADAPNRKWLTDIMQIPCRDGKLYIAPVLDCYNGEIVGLAMDDNMKKELCIRAFESACKSQFAGSMILHSDRDNQFNALARHGAVQSMSGTGRCYDNARMESFFATLKKEKLYQIQAGKMPISQVRSIIFRYIMICYNRIRVNTVNPRGVPPTMYRQDAKGLAA